MSVERFLTQQEKKKHHDPSIRENVDGFFLIALHYSIFYHGQDGDSIDLGKKHSRMREDYCISGVSDGVVVA